MVTVLPSFSRIIFYKPDCSRKRRTVVRLSPNSHVAVRHTLKILVSPVLRRKKRGLRVVCLSGLLEECPLNLKDGDSESCVVRLERRCLHRYLHRSGTPERLGRTSRQLSLRLYGYCPLNLKDGDLGLLVYNLWAPVSITNFLEGLYEYCH